jgi:hypothetical protein
LCATLNTPLSEILRVKLDEAVAWKEAIDVYREPPPSE